MFQSFAFTNLLSQIIDGVQSDFFAKKIARGLGFVAHRPSSIVDASRAVVHIPAWLLARYFVLAEELERMHGAAFAAAFLNDIGVVPESRVLEGRRRLVVRKGGLYVRQRTDNADCV